ncbi:unnamed protein product [Didymodactylos carnosus]|uniref:F-box domain-containing protein n=1 Tax=Didymodactylos carnosus TaxID=1234261 RepID=A0A814VER4_9BILA|nr:unnamed protein product [Didymodactylos carnosus]CAF3950228.1 unnamed protein product [Didymodactylos carnosus]
MTTIHNLSNDVIIEIFDYLNDIDILYSFFNIKKKRFEQLITRYTSEINITKYLSSFKVFSYFCFSILPFIGKNITSLSLGNENSCDQIQLFILSNQELNLKNEFIQLKYLQLYFDGENDILPFICLFSNLFELKLAKSIEKQLLFELTTLTILNAVFNENNLYLNKCSIEQISISSFVNQHSGKCLIRNLNIVNSID